MWPRPFVRIRRLPILALLSSGLFALLYFRSPGSKADFDSKEGLSGAEWKAIKDRHCSTLLGNIYGEEANICHPSDRDPSSELTCWKNDVTGAMICHATNVIVDNTLINCSSGGENIGSVIGRPATDEYPVYKSGALKLYSWPKYNMMGRELYHLREMLVSIEEASRDVSYCKELANKPALFITRYEYVNLYHTMMDWYNTYKAIQMFSLFGKSFDIIFFDGHARGILDEAWFVLFGTKPKYVKHLRNLSCYRNVIFVPASYSSGLFIDNVQELSLLCRNNEFVLDFVRYFLARHQLPERNITESVKKTVTVILREDYLAHPRSTGTPRKFKNAPELTASIERLLPEAKVQSVRLEAMSIKKQLEVIRESTVLVGIHGAALTHCLFLQPDSIMLELKPEDFLNVSIHFEYLSALVDVKYSSLQIGPADGMGRHEVDSTHIAKTIAKFINEMDDDDKE